MPPGKNKFLKVHLRVQPGASKKEIRYFSRKSSGKSSDERANKTSGKRIKVYVNAPPEDGKANKELIKFLAGELNISKAGIKIIKGKTARDKVIKIKGMTASGFRDIIKTEKS
ncbi:MAG: DUF167 domain-containing protein [Elusimicrobia bacterium]|jgi:uncharacterized protein (TIGR00251 family)|nr:DUF167 domain-containing protein [Elusimicrobiota bacterium]